jgi:hypothetical protein
VKSMKEKFWSVNVNSTAKKIKRPTNKRAPTSECH